MREIVAEEDAIALEVRSAICFDDSMGVCLLTLLIPHV